MWDETMFNLSEKQNEEVSFCVHLLNRNDIRCLR